MFKVSVVITSRNRKELLQRSLRSVVAQDYPELEVLVMDDASDDGTGEMIEKEFPEVRHVYSEKQKGLIVLRDEAFGLVSGEVVFSLDDDAYFTTNGTLTQLMGYWEKQDDSVAALAVPFYEPGESGGGGAFKPGQEMRCYYGCSHLISVEVARRLGGYRTELGVRQGEERDMCIRIANSGMKTVVADCPHVVHTPSGSRDYEALFRLGIRNTLLFDWLNLPFPEACFFIGKHSFQLFFYKLELSNAFPKIKVLLETYVELISLLSKRSPVSRKALQKYFNLEPHGAIKISAQDIPPPIG